MSYITTQIREKFGKKLVGKDQMKNQVVQALQKLPDNLIRYVTENVWFVSSFDDAFGFVITGEELQGKQLIFLSDDLFSEDQEQISYTIIHEIGHVVLKHHNAILEIQSKSEVDKQETEADQFAKGYLK
jgi:Zn-dependent peptidase ImmA (M78 family)